MTAETRRTLRTIGIAAGILHLFLFGILFGITEHPGALFGIAAAGALLIGSTLYRPGEIEQPDLHGD